MSTTFWIKVAIVIAIILVIWFIYKKVTDRIAINKAKSAFDKYSVQSKTPDGASYSLNPATVAAEIYAAFHEYYYGMAEDEESAIQAILNVPKAFVKNVSDAYYSLYKKNLSDEFINYLDPEEYKKVRSQFN